MITRFGIAVSFHRGNCGMLFCVRRTFDMNNRWLIGIPAFSAVGPSVPLALVELITVARRAFPKRMTSPRVRADIQDWVPYFSFQLCNHFCRRYVRESYEFSRVCEDNSCMLAEILRRGRSYGQPFGRDPIDKRNSSSTPCCSIHVPTYVLLKCI